MQFTIFTVAAGLAWATGAAAAPASDASQSLFHVKGFHTVCSEGVSQVCTSNFNISYASVQSAPCSVKSTDTDYVVCGVVSPEQSYGAYIKKPAHKNGPHTLQVLYQFSLPGDNDVTYGNTTVPKRKPNFSFPPSGETKTS